MPTSLDHLTALVVRGAFHNSGERFDAPTCHEDTRLAIIDDIVAWLDDVTDPRPVMWMNGAAGTGKSAIAQTVAKLLYDQGRLTASFFYSRLAADLGRRDDSRVVITLAYQLFQNIPESRGYISAAIDHDQLLFELTLETQLQKLIVEPISFCSEELSLAAPAKLIIIDGLDESSSKDRQRSIVKSLVAAFAQISARCKNLPHKLLISSRPEQHILSTFSHPSITNHVNIMSVDYHPDVDSDIRKYLTICFSTIKKVHPLRAQLDVQWPPSDTIDDLVERSSGQFIFAATVKKYVESEQHDPIVRLNTIISLSRDPGSAPYADLDALYTHILLQLADDAQISLALQILYVVLLRPSNRTSNHQSSKSDLDHISLVHYLFNVSKHSVFLALANLSSILTVDPHGTVKLFHASFPDFLFDETRSGPFYIHRASVSASIFRACFNCIPRLTGILKASVRRICADLCCYYPPKISYRNPELLSEIPSLSRTIRFQQFLQTLSGRGPDRNVLLGFLNWMLHEEQHFPGGVEQLHNWTRTQLTKIPDSKAVSVINTQRISPVQTEWLLKIVTDPQFVLWWDLVSAMGLHGPFSHCCYDIPRFGKYALSQEKIRHCALQYYDFLFNHFESGTDYGAMLTVLGIFDYAERFLAFTEPDIYLYSSLLGFLIDAHGGTQDAPERLMSYFINNERGSDNGGASSDIRDFLDKYFRRKMIWWPASGYSLYSFSGGIVDFIDRTRAAFPSLETTLNNLD